MVKTPVFARSLNGQEIGGLFHNTNGGLIAFFVTTDVTRVHFRKLKTLAANSGFAFEFLNASGEPLGKTVLTGEDEKGQARGGLFANSG
jgi:hypothetical protein